MIDNNAFVIEGSTLVKYQGNEKAVIIPDGITTIGEKAFLDCNSLENVIIPESVICIKKYAFANCKKLEKIDIHDKMAEIEDCAFYGCEGLKVFKMHPECKVKVIVTSALHCCPNLEYLYIPNSQKGPLQHLQRIFDYPGYIFWSHIPNTDYDKDMQLKIIARNVSIKLVPSNEKEAYLKGFIEYSSEYKNEVTKDYYDYLKRTIKKWQPEFVKDIGFLRLILNNNILKKEKVDEVLEEVQKTGDAEKIALMMDYIKANYGTGLDSYYDRLEAKDKEEEKKEARKKTAEKKKKTLEEKRKDPNADVKTVWTIKKNIGTCKLSNYKGNAEELVIPSEVDGLKVTEIAKSYKDKGYDSVKSIVLPDTVTHLGDNAFSYCRNLESIHLGKSLWATGSSPFMGCFNLKEIVLPEGVKSTSNYMFRDCYNLEKIVFESRDYISYKPGCNFLRGATKAIIYVHRGVNLSGFNIGKKKIRIIEDMEK